jgi:hypothetical protein
VMKEAFSAAQERFKNVATGGDNWSVFKEYSHFR